MALAFNNKPITTIKARVTGTTENVAFAGCTADNSLTPADAATQMNKILAIVGKTVTADTNMVRTQVQEVVDNV